MKTPRIALLSALAAVVTSAVVLTGCIALDVVGRTAATTFKALVERGASSIARDESTGRWVLSSPGSERFEWSGDFSGPGPDPHFLMSLGVGAMGFSAPVGSSRGSARICLAVDAFLMPCDLS